MEKVKKARKEYTCEKCNGVIEKGSKYLFSSGKFPTYHGDVQTGVEFHSWKEHLPELHCHWPAECKAGKHQLQSYTEANPEDENCGKTFCWCFNCSESFDQIHNLRKLHLVLTEKWFEMINQEIKTDEYRSLTDFWCRRFYDYAKATEDDLPFKEFDVVEFQHGYSKTARRMIVEFKGFDLGTGKPEWGGSSEVVFIIKLGKILNRNF